MGFCEGFRSEVFDDTCIAMRRDFFDNVRPAETGRKGGVVGDNIMSYFDYIVDIKMTFSAAFIGPCFELFSVLFSEVMYSLEEFLVLDLDMVHELCKGLWGFR